MISESWKAHAVTRRWQDRGPNATAWGSNARGSLYRSTFGGCTSLPLLPLSLRTPHAPLFSRESTKHLDLYMQQYSPTYLKMTQPSLTIGSHDSLALPSSSSSPRGVCVSTPAPSPSLCRAEQNQFSMSRNGMRFHRTHRSICYITSQVQKLRCWLHARGSRDKPPSLHPFCLYLSLGWSLGLNAATEASVHECQW